MYRASCCCFPSDNGKNSFIVSSVRGLSLTDVTGRYFSSGVRKESAEGDSQSLFDLFVPVTHRKRLMCGDCLTEMKIEGHLVQVLSKSRHGFMG